MPGQDSVKTVDEIKRAGLCFRGNQLGKDVMQGDVGIEQVNIGKATRSSA